MLGAQPLIRNKKNIIVEQKTLGSSTEKGNFSMASKPINIRWIRTILSHNKKLCMASYYRQLSMNNNIKIIIFLALANQLLRANNKELIMQVFILISAES